MKSLFLKFWVENKYFWKTFKLIFMHFIHEIIWIKCFLHKTSAIFQKIQISRISMDRMCFLTDRKSLEFISFVSAWFDWSSIGARLVESVFRLIETNFWSIVILKFLKKTFYLAQLVPDRYSINRDSKEKRNKRLFSARVHHFFKHFSLFFFLFFLDRSNSNFFCCFPPQLFKGFCPQV